MVREAAARVMHAETITITFLKSPSCKRLSRYFVAIEQGMTRVGHNRVNADVCPSWFLREQLGSCMRVQSMYRNVVYRTHVCACKVCTVTLCTELMYACAKYVP